MRALNVWKHRRLDVTNERYSSTVLKLYKVGNDMRGA